jgi:hypothetical protein
VQIADRTASLGLTLKQWGTDIQRQPVKNRRRFLYLAAAIVAVVATTVGLSRLKPAAPRSSSGPSGWTLCGRDRWSGGPGSRTLVPEEIRWISAVTPGEWTGCWCSPG